MYFKVSFGHKIFIQSLTEMASGKKHSGYDQQISENKGLLFLTFSTLLMATHCSGQSPNKLPRPRKFYLTWQQTVSIISPETALPSALFCLKFPPSSSHSPFPPTAIIPFAWSVWCFHSSPVILCIIAKVSLLLGSFLRVSHR